MLNMVNYVHDFNRSFGAKPGEHGLEQNPCLWRESTFKLPCHELRFLPANSGCADVYPASWLETQQHMVVS